MNEILQVLAVLIAAVWWGALIGIDFIVIPSHFRTPNIERDVIFAVGRQVFHTFGLIQLGLGLLLLIVTLAGGTEAAVIMLAVFMLILAGLNVAVLEPMMAAIRRKAGGPIQEGTPDHARYRQYHQAYFASDIFRIAMGAMVLVALVIA